MPFWILDCRFWIEERLTGQASHLGSHSTNFISCISKSNGYQLKDPFPDNLLFLKRAYTILDFRLAILDWRKPCQSSVPPILLLASPSQIGISKISSVGYLS